MTSLVHFLSDHCAWQELYYCVKLNRIFSPATYLAGPIETENCTIEFIGSTIQCISWQYGLWSFQTGGTKLEWILSTGHGTKVPKNPFISNLKGPACASNLDVLELATLRYVDS